MGISIEELNRAGLVGSGGELRKVKNADRFVQASDEAACAHIGDSRQDPELQEQQDADKAVSEGAVAGFSLGEYPIDNGAIESVPEEASDDDNAARLSAPDGSDDCQHRITITVRFSNRLRTDLSGKLDTILDCIVRARRRLLDKITGDTHSSGTVRAGKRGSQRHHREIVRGKVPF